MFRPAAVEIKLNALSRSEPDFRLRTLGVHQKVGGQAARLPSIRNRGYHRRKTSSNSWLRTFVRVCNSRCAPRSVHAICCFFTNRLLTTWLIVDSTKEVLIV